MTEAIIQGLPEHRTTSAYSRFEGSGLSLHLEGDPYTVKFIRTTRVDLQYDILESEGAQVFANDVARPRHEDCRVEKTETGRVGDPKTPDLQQPNMKQKQSGMATGGLPSRSRKAFKVAGERYHWTGAIPDQCKLLLQGSIHHHRDQTQRCDELAGLRSPTG